MCQLLFNYTQMQTRTKLFSLSPRKHIYKPYFDVSQMQAKNLENIPKFTIEQLCKPFVTQRQAITYNFIKYLFSHICKP